jgi:transposase
MRSEKSNIATSDISGQMPTKSASVRRRGLSITQLNAIDLLVLGFTDGKVAAMVGVCRSTVNEWKNHHDLFKKELAERREDTWSSPRIKVKEKVAGQMMLNEADDQALKSHQTQT